MTRVGRSLLYVAAVGGVLALSIGAWLFSRRGEIVRVDSGPVGERVVARAVVVPSGGVIHVFAAADGRVVRLASREGDSVEVGQTLAELDVAGHSERLTAPARGVVLARHAELGDYALAAAHGAPAPLFELADPTQTELRVEVEEADAARLVTKLPVEISAPGGLSVHDSAPGAGSGHNSAPGAESSHDSTRVRGQVERVSGRLERRTIGADDARVRADGMVRVVAVSWPAGHPAWPLGARAEVSIELRRRAAAARLPRSALSVRDGRSIVECPVALWTREVPVEILSVDDAYAEIRGLAPGSEVVIPRRAVHEAAVRQADRVDSVEALR
jgi:multidrug efflux pump subunit AcrA (membrane-fusion protein)